MQISSFKYSYFFVSYLLLFSNTKSSNANSTQVQWPTYRAETSLWSISGESAKLMVGLPWCTMNSKADFREKRLVLAIKGLTEMHLQKQTNCFWRMMPWQCSFISLFTTILKPAVTVTLILFAKYFCHRNSGPKAFLDCQNSQKNTGNGPSLLLDDVIADTNQVI